MQALWLGLVYPPQAEGYIYICDPLWEKVCFGRKNCFEKRVKMMNFGQSG